MSARERLKREIDYMSDDVVSAIITICGINDEIPNEDTRQAYEDAINGRFEQSFDNAEDLISYIHSLGDEDEEL
ncbi:MAG: hypothetical protein LBM59_00495 [Ruminococcus sp.]|jgi:hypothetical protein|nr:hypothetical protein [Ruminococcus sp.]